MTDDNGDVRSALTAALARRARAVEVEATPRARAAVDRHRARRTRRRQTRSLAAVGIAVAVALGSGVFIAQLRDDHPPAVVAGNDSSLPRVIVDGRAGLRPVPDQGDLVTLAVEDTNEMTQLQVFRPADGQLPAIFAPWSPAGARRPLPQPSGDAESVVVGDDTAGVLSGRADGLRMLSFQLDDGTKVYLYAFGVAEQDLLAVAAGLVQRGRASSGVGFEPPDLPAGWVARLEPPGSAAPRPRASYTLTGRGLEVTVEVRAGNAFTADAQLLSLLSTAASAESVRVAGRPGSLICEAAGPCRLTWRPDDTSVATITISTADRNEIDRVVSAVRLGTAAEWEALAEEVRG